MNEHDDLIAHLEALAESAREARAYAEAGEAHSTDLVAVGSDVTSRRAALVAARADGERLRQDIERRAADLATTVQAMVRAATAELEPLRERLALLTDGVRALDLYAGRDEDWLVVTDGPAAPEGTPITVRQRVLAMDEETLIAADDGGLTGRDVHQFIDWLRADQAHIDQLLPEQKGIVGLRPRANPARYSDPWEGIARASEDVYPYLLVRNGGRVYLYDVASGVHHWGDRLVPLRDEFTAMFTVEDRLSGVTRQLEPGSREWDRAEKAAGARQRHYMATALVLQGIIDRTTILHPLPPGVSVVDPASYDAGHVVVVADADLTLADGAETYDEWRRRLLADLRLGMRVVFSTADMWRKEDLDVWPPTASRPDAGPHEVVAVERGLYGERFKVLYDRTDTIWVEGHHDNQGRWVRSEQRTPSTRASIWFYRNDGFVVPFDGATVAEIDRLIANRGTRRRYLEAIPLLRNLRAAIVAEQGTEQPFRQMLAGVLARDTGRPVADCEPHVDGLVDWWKFKNRTHRPLVGDEAANSAAVRSIIAEFRRRMADWDKPINTKLVDRLAAEPGCLLVARKRSGKYVTLRPTEGSPVFVTETEHGVRSGPGEPKPWLLVGSRTANWQVLWTSPEWADWPVWTQRSEVLTGPETARLVDRIVAGSDEPVTAVCYLPAERRFDVWLGFDAGTTACIERRWSRNGDGTPNLARGYEHNRSSGQAPWTTWGDRWEKAGGYVILYVDDTAAAVHAEAVKAHSAAEAAARRRRDRVYAYVVALRGQWRDREEAAVYARFLEDYGDASLWEQHQRDATSSIRGQNWPDGLHEAEKLIAKAVDGNIEFDGLTVAELAAVLGDDAPTEMADLVLAANKEGDYE